jgi:hypothetical protein
MSKITRIVAAAAVLGVVGVSALPVAGYAATASDPVNVTLTVTDGLSLDCPDNYTHGYGPAVNATDSTGSASEGTPATCTVISNDAQGYTLKVGATTNTTLSNGVQTIPTSATHVAGTPGWSIDYATTTGGNLSGTRKAVAASASPATVADTTAVSADTGDTYKYGFATSISATTVAGTYTGGVTFTATGK